MKVLRRGLIFCPFKGEDISGNVSKREQYLSTAAGRDDYQNRSVHLIVRNTEGPNRTKICS